MTTQTHLISRYRFVMDVSQGAVSRITLWGEKDALIGEIAGLETGRPLPSPKFKRAGSEFSHVTTFVHADALPALVGMLRHEKNVYLNIDDTPPGFVTIEAGENAS